MYILYLALKTLKKNFFKTSRMQSAYVSVIQRENRHSYLCCEVTATEARFLALLATHDPL